MDIAKAFATLDEIIRNLTRCPTTSTTDVATINAKLKERVQIIHAINIFKIHCPALFQSHVINNVRHNIIVQTATTPLEWCFALERDKNISNVVKMSCPHDNSIFVNNKFVLFQTRYNRDYGGWFMFGKPRIFFCVGDDVDARDHLGTWYPSKIVSVEPNRVSVHFKGWEDRYDEWIYLRCNRTLSNQELYCDETHSDSCPVRIVPPGTKKFNARWCAPAAWIFLRHQLQLSPYVTNADFFRAIVELTNLHYEHFVPPGDTHFVPPGDTWVWYDRWVLEQGQSVLPVQTLHSLIKEYIVDDYYF